MPMTLRELAWMHDGLRTEAWNHTASLMMLIANCNIDTRKQRAFTVATFHPMMDANAAPSTRGIRITAANISLLKCRLPDAERN